MPIYNLTHKKEIRFVDKRIPWQFAFPYDFQYRIFKEGNQWNLEGMNLGFPKIFVRSTVLENRKNISLQEFEKAFFNCKTLDITLNLENHPYLRNYKICQRDEFIELRSYLYFNHQYFLFYLVFFQVNFEEETIKNFLSSIEFVLN